MSEPNGQQEPQEYGPVPQFLLPAAAPQSQHPHAQPQPQPQQPLTPPPVQPAPQFAAPFAPPAQQFPAASSPQPQPPFAPRQPPFAPPTADQRAAPQFPPQQFPPQAAPFPSQAPQFPAQQPYYGPVPPQQRQPQFGTPAKRKPTALILAVVLVVLAGAGVGGWLLLGRGGSGGSGGTGGTGGTGLRVAWSQSAPSSLPSNAQTDGAWVSGDTVAVITDSAIAGYALDSGRPTWTWTPPSGTKICAASQDVSGGIGAVATGTDPTTCTNLLAVNVADGKPAWARAASLRRPGSDDPSDEFPDLIVAGGSVYAVDNTLALDAFDLTTGASRWSSASDPAEQSQNCLVDGANALNGTVYAGMSCDDGAFLIGYGADGGKQASKTPMPQDCSAETILKYVWIAGKDVLVDCSDTDHDTTHARFDIFDPSTGRLTPVTLPSVKMDPLNASGTQQTPYGYAVSGDTLFVETLSGANDDGTKEVLDAVSLSTGETSWSKPLPRNFVILRGDANGCLGLAYAVTGDSDLDVVELAAASGAPGTLGTLNGTNGAYHDLAHQTLIQAGGRLVMVGETADPSAPLVSALDGD